MIRIIAAFFLTLLLASNLFAQSNSRICYTTNGTNCVPVSTSDPFPVTVSNAAAITIGAITGTGKAGTPAGDILTVQGVASMTPLLATLSGTNTITGITNTVTIQVAGSTFTNITTNTDTNVKASAGTLVGFTVNTAGTTSSVQFFNDADGTCSSGLIGTYSTLAQNSVIINAAATIGICAKTAGGAAADITVLWR